MLGSSANCEKVGALWIDKPAEEEDGVTTLMSFWVWRKIMQSEGWGEVENTELWAVVGMVKQPW